MPAVLLLRCWRTKTEAEGAQRAMRPTEGICARRVAERRESIVGVGVLSEEDK